MFRRLHSHASAVFGGSALTNLTADNISSWSTNQLRRRTDVNRSSAAGRPRNPPRHFTFEHRSVALCVHRSKNFSRERRAGATCVRARDKAVSRIICNRNKTIFLFSTMPTTECNSYVCVCVFKYVSVSNIYKC